MANHFDVAAKYPFDVDPAGMLAVCGLKVDGRVSPYKTDLSTRLEPDRLFRIDGKPPWLAHVEIQLGPCQCLDLRVERYNTVAEYLVANESNFREQLPVLSTLFLLHPRADSPKLTGVRVKMGPDGSPYGSFRYNVIRLWRLPAKDLINGPLASLPFVTLAKANKRELPQVVKRLEERLTSEGDPEISNELRICSWLLMGAKYSREFVNFCPWRKDMMEVSSTYRQLIEEGIEKGMEKGMEKGIEQGILIGKRDDLLRLGNRKLGPATKAVQKSLAAISNPAQLEIMMDEIDQAKNWSELLRLAVR